MTREEVLKIIGVEREFQELKWGTISDHGHEVGAWITLMRKHLNDAEAAWCEKPSDYDALDEIRKVAALAVACGEQHGLIERPAISLQIQRSARAVKARIA